MFFIFLFDNTHPHYSKGFSKIKISFSFLISNSYGLLKVPKSKIIQETIQVQNSGYIKIREPSDITLRQIAAGPNFFTRRLSNQVKVLLKPF